MGTDVTARVNKRIEYVVFFSIRLVPSLTTILRLREPFQPDPFFHVVVRLDMTHVGKDSLSRSATLWNIRRQMFGCFYSALLFCDHPTIYCS